MQQCGEAAISIKQEICQSERHCRIGLDRGECAICLPEEAQCDDRNLKKCADDGSGFVVVETCDTAALCNATAGACTDKACLPDSWICENDSLRRCNEDQTAFEEVQPCESGMCDAEERQCDICIENKVRCKNNQKLICDAAGQEETSESCPANKPICVGEGKCIECLTKSDCGPPAACKLYDCNDNICTESNAKRGSSCTRLFVLSGVCDGSGNCVECNDDDDCVGKVAGVDTCNEAACVNKECTTRPTPWVVCGQNRICNTSGSCEASCGNGHFDQGIEECDPTAGWDNWSCNQETCKITGLSVTTSYHTCANQSDCSNGEVCKQTPLLTAWMACIPRCSASGACSIPPGYDVYIVSNSTFCNSNEYDCAVECSSDAQCPPGIPCQGTICGKPDFGN